MATQENTWNVANRLHSNKDSDNPELNHIITGADEIYDDEKGKKQSQINEEVGEELDLHTNRLNALTGQNYVTVATFAELPVVGQVDTIYRVCRYDGSIPAVDSSKYTEYAWTGEAYLVLSVKDNHEAQLVGYYVCSTNANVAEKAISIPGFSLPVSGGAIKIKMINANTAVSGVKLRINDGTQNIDKALIYNSEVVSASNTWEAGEVVEVYYDPSADSGNGAYFANNVAGGSGSGDGAFDVSAKYPTSGTEGGNTYTLEGALAVLNTNLSANKKKGGMSIKFIQSSDNKYVQYRLMSDTFNTTVANWQGIDNTLKAGSQDLATSSGIAKTGRVFNFVGKGTTGITQLVSGILNGHIYKLYTIGTENFVTTATTPTVYAEFGYKNNLGNYVRLKVNTDFSLNNFLSVKITDDIYYDGFELFIYAKVASGEVVRFILEDVTDNALNIEHELIGAGSQIQWLPYNVPVLAGHKYRMYLYDKNIPVNNVTGYSILNVVVYDSAGTEITPRLVEVLLNTPLENYYDIDIPVNAAYARISMRANQGAKQIFFLQDITLTENIKEDVAELDNEVEGINTFLEDKVGENIGTTTKATWKRYEYDASVRYYIYRVDGRALSSSSKKYEASNFINVEDVKRITFTGALQIQLSDPGAAFYTDDDESAFLSGVTYDYDSSIQELTYKQYTIDVPSGAKYFRFSIPSAYSSMNTVILEKEGIISDYFVPKDTQEHSMALLMNYGYITTDGTTQKGSGNERWNRAYSKLIKINGVLLDYPSTNEGRFVLYDETFTFVKFSKDLEEINSAAYIRAYRNEQNSIIPDTFNISYRGSIEILNEPRLSVNTFAPTWFTVDVALPMDNPTTAWANVERLYTNAWVSLPWNYRQSGKKNKLIVYGTGTTGAKWDSITDGFDEKCNFFNAMGYAVLVVNANTIKYKTTRRNNCATPLGVACFTAAVKYAVENFNMEDAIYIYGKSAGGMTAMSLINTSQLKIKTAAIHCPNLDAFNDFRCMSPVSNNGEVGYFQQFNLDVPESGWDGTSTSANNTALAQMKTKQNEFDGYNPMTFKCTIDKKSYNDYILDNPYPLSSGSYPNSIMKDYSDTYLMGETMQSLVEDAKLFLNIPIKIWYADDDQQVPYGTIVNFAKMASNAGCVCKLRKFADGTGGHSCADAWSQSQAAAAHLAPRVDIQTRYGGVMNMPLGIVEALQWLELW